MFIARCQKCGEIMGAIRNPARFTWIQCMKCRHQNNILHCVDPNENYDHPDDKMVNEREADLHSQAMKNIQGITGK